MLAIVESVSYSLSAHWVKNHPGWSIVNNKTADLNTKVSRTYKTRLCLKYNYYCALLARRKPATARFPQTSSTDLWLAWTWSSSQLKLFFLTFSFTIHTEAWVGSTWTFIHKISNSSFTVYIRDSLVEKDYVIWNKRNEGLVRDRGGNESKEHCVQTETMKTSLQARATAISGTLQLSPVSHALTLYRNIDVACYNRAQQQEYQRASQKISQFWHFLIIPSKSKWRSQGPKHSCEINAQHLYPFIMRN